MNVILLCSSLILCLVVALLKNIFILKYIKIFLFIYLYFIYNIIKKLKKHQFFKIKNIFKTYLGIIRIFIPLQYQSSFPNKS